MLKNYEFKNIEICLIDGEKIEASANSITELGIHITKQNVHQFIPWTSIKRIKREETD